MRRVIIETPYKAQRFWQRWANVRYARKCMRDSLFKNEAPMLSHLLYTQTLDDNNPWERERGIRAGFAWGLKAEATVVYVDRGISQGMRLGISAAKDAKRAVEYRALDPSNLLTPDLG